MLALRPLAGSEQVLENFQLKHYSLTGLTGLQEGKMRKWQMQQAKAKFAEVIRRAAAEGPQVVTYRGSETAVVLSMKEYQRLNATRPNFAEFLLSSPKWDDKTIAAINDRSKDTGRDVDL
jgi:prevent-host-death family protein